MYGVPASTRPLCLLCKGSLQRCYYRVTVTIEPEHLIPGISLNSQQQKKKNCGTDLISPAPPEWSKGFSLWKPKAACRSSLAQLAFGTVQRERTHYLQRNTANLQFDLRDFKKPPLSQACWSSSWRPGKTRILLQQLWHIWWGMVLPSVPQCSLTGPDWGDVHSARL